MKVQVTINNVKIIKETGLNENEYNIHEFEFDFVEEYEGLTKKAVFTDANEQSYIETIVNNKCSVPTEVLHKNEYVTIGVYAYAVEDEELKLRYSPQPTHFFVNEGSYKSVNNSTPPTPSEIEQLQSQITQNSNDIDVLEGNILNLQEEQVEQNRNIQANADDIEEIQQEQITQNTNIQKNTDDIVEINQNINEIDGHIDAINQNIDNLEQELTNYSLITETGSQINLNVNSTNYQITAILKDKNGNVIYTSNAIDLPIESMIVNARYDNTTKEIVLTLQNGNTLRISVADLVSGLVSETQLQTILANYYNKTEVDNLLSNLAERVSTNEEDIADIKEEQTTQNTNIEELQSQVETLQEDLESANSEIEELNTDITNMRKAMLQVEGQGSDITLQNTSENKFVEFGLEGRTEQEQLSGKNLANNKFSDWTSTSAYSYIPINLEQGQTYSFWATLVGELKVNYYNLGIVKDGTSYGTFEGLRLVVDTNGTTASRYTFTVDETWTNPKLVGYFDRNETKFNELFQNYNIQLEQGSTATSYERYCGGIPSPNPQYPQPIKNVTGNANVKIQNLVNFLDWNKFIDYSNWENALSSDYKMFLINGLKANTKYTLCRIDDIGLRLGVYACFNSIGNNTNRFIHSTNEDENRQFVSATSNSQGKLYIVATPIKSQANLQNLANNIIKDCWVIEGENYIQKDEQNYPFTFAEGQRGMQETKLLDDGIHQKRKQGTVNINSIVTLANGNIGGICNIPDKILNTTSVVYSECAIFTATRTNVEGTVYANNSNVVFVGNSEDTLETLKEKLDGSIIEYELETEEIIPYNETQQAQYNAIKEASSYDDITYITSTSDELGFNMDVESLANANKVIDSLDTRLSALEGNTNQSKNLKTEVDTKENIKDITKETAEDTAENAENSAESEEQ